MDQWENIFFIECANENLDMKVIQEGKRIVLVTTIPSWKMCRLIDVYTNKIDTDDWSWNA